MPSRRGGEKGFPKAAPPRRGGDKGSSRRGKEKRFPKGGSQEDAVIKTGRLDRKKGFRKAGSEEEEKKRMPEEMVNDILSWEKPPRFTMFKSAGFFNKLRDELFEYQQEIKEEVEEKGYAELPDDFKEYTKEADIKAYRKAYLKVFGTEPPPELCSL